MASRNLVLIVIDSMRADRLSRNGDADLANSGIDRLAASGLVFEQAIAQGHATWTTMPTILSGCYPSMYGGFEHLSDDRPRLASVLKELGYQTAAFAPNPYLTRSRGYESGFDLFDEALARSSRHTTSWQALFARGFNRLLGRWGIGIECPPYLDARSLTDRAIHWLEHASDPFFLWLHYMDAHMPYNVQRCALLLPKGKGQRPYPYGFWRHCVQNPDEITPPEAALAQRLYQEGIAFIDSQIGRLQNAVSQLAHPLQTTFIVTADHGEEFREHGLFGHQNHLYEENIRVPLLISPVDAAGHRFSGQVRHLDLAPTLIELAEGTPPQEMQGTSLLPILKGDTRAGHLPAITQSHPRTNWQISLRTPPWKLIWRLDPGSLQSHHLELYRLDSDPGERHNLARRFPEKVAEMQNILEKHVADLNLAPAGSGSIEETDPVVLERLRALGYFDGA